MKNVLLLSLSLMISPAFAAGTVNCQFLEGASGMRTIVSADGQFGESEDGSPVQVEGYQLALQCGKVSRNLFFYLNDEAIFVQGLFTGAHDLTAVSFSEQSIGGMGGRQAVVVKSVDAGTLGTLEQLNGAELN